MSSVRVIPIVEGHGEVAAVPILLRRIGAEMLDGAHFEILTPIRQRRSVLLQETGLCHAIDLASAKLNNPGLPNDPRLILVLIDADEDLPCILGPRLHSMAQSHRPDTQIICIVANKEFESWFVAAAASLTNYLTVESKNDLAIDPESEGLGKAWIASRFSRVRYSERIDQPRLTAKFDLNLARRNSASFDKLCRELERFVHR